MISNYPKFFDEVENIEVYEPFVEFLGAGDGKMTYSYIDAVKLAGHSCPTVAGAYLSTLVALKALYTDKKPTRGEIKVEFREGVSEGTAGVVASIVSLITGAKGEDGFGGIGERFKRRSLLSFGASIKGEMRFTRLDSGAAVEIEANIQSLPLPPLNGEVFKKNLTNAASDGEKEQFQREWQARVKAVLIEHKESAIRVL